MPELEMEELSADFIQEAAFVTDTTCPACYAEFLDADDLLIHIKQVHSADLRLHPCQLCPATYTDLIDYAKHVRDSHIIDLRACNYCSKVFLNGAQLKIHQSRHEGEEGLCACSQCQTLFPNVLLLELHELQYHDNTSDGVLLKCMDHLSELLCLNAKRLLQSVGKKHLKCLMCSFTTGNLREYTSHLNNMKCKSYVCGLCASVFRNKKSLKKHILLTKRCQDIGKCVTPVTCSDCKRRVHPQAMETHLNSCKALRCVDCGFVCRTINKLSKHQSDMHPQDVSFTKCKYCVREFIGVHPMKNHIRRVHKPTFHLYKYKCMTCNAIFQHPQKLFAHYFSNHRTLLPFNCKICNKSFRVRKGFSLHIKLDHNSVGYVEFDDQYHVFFTAIKSDNPFVPKCVIPPEEFTAYDLADPDKKTKAQSDTDVTNADTEDENPKRKPKPNKAKLTKKTINESMLLDSSDDEPLLEVRKRAMKRKRSRKLKKRNPQFICDICNKNCFTYQNHKNHMSTHKKNQELECVKCSEKFKSKIALNQHMSADHASSKLTETLKNLLKKKQQDPTLDQTNKKQEPFKVVLRKVKSFPNAPPATIKPVEPNLSVKNFIENFTPDINVPPKPAIEIKTSVTIKAWNGQRREPQIKLIKYKDVQTYEPVPLKMPQRFKQSEPFGRTKVSIRLLEASEQGLPDLDHDYTESHAQDDDYDRNDIPEVAQEVSLEGTEETPRFRVDAPKTKIVIPKMPKGYSKIHIATLQPEAPYFKIIKVDSDNMTEIKKKDKCAPSSGEVISLPDGQRLVSANPLAHLLGDSLPGPARSARSARHARDFQGLLATALRRMQDPPAGKKRGRKGKGKLEEE